MADTVETLLVKMGLDPSSLSSFISEVKKEVLEAEAKNQIKIQVKADVDALKEQLEAENRVKVLMEVDSSQLDQIPKTLEEIDAEAKAAASAIDDSLGKSFGDIHALVADAKISLSEVAETLLQDLERVSFFLAGIGAGIAGLFAKATHAFEDERVASKRLEISFGSLSEEAEALVPKIQAINNRLDNEAIKNALAKFNQIGESFQLTSKEAFDFSESLTKVAAGLGKAFGKDTEEVFGQIQFGILRGGRALREYGVDLDESRVKQEAANRGWDPEHLEKYQEALIKQSFILKDTAKLIDLSSRGQDDYKTATKALANETEQLFQTLGKLVSTALIPGVKFITDIVVAMKEWISAHPATITMLVDIGRWLTIIGSIMSILVAKMALLRTAAFLTGAETASAMGVAAKGTSSLAGVFLWLEGIIGTGLTVALTYLAAAGVAAFAGWNVGKVIDDVLGLGKAVDNVTKGTATAGDKIKDYFVTVLQGPVGVINKLDNSWKMYKATTEQVAASNKLEASFKNDSAGMERLNFLIAEGVPKWKALIVAGDEISFMEFLRAKGTKASADELERLTALEAKYADVIAVSSGRLTENERVTKEAEKARKKLEETDAETAKKAEEAVDKAQADLHKAKLIDQFGESAAKKKLIQEEADQKKFEATRNNQTFNPAADNAIENEKNLKLALIDTEEATKKREEAQKQYKEGLKKTTEEEIQAQEDLMKAEEREATSYSEQLTREIALIDKKREKELADLKSSGGDSEAAREKIDQARELRVKKAALDIEKTRQEAIKKTAQEADAAERQLQEARAKSTETLKDDLDLMNQRMELEKATKKTIEEKDDVERKWFAEKKRLIEEVARKEKEAADKAKQQILDFAQAQINAQNIRLGKAAGVGGVAEVGIARAQFVGNVDAQLKNVIDKPTADKLKQGIDAGIDNLKADIEKLLQEAEKRFVDAQKRFKEVKQGKTTIQEKQDAAQELRDAITDKNNLDAKLQTQRLLTESVRDEEKAKVDIALKDKQAADAVEAKARDEALGKQKAERDAAIDRGEARIGPTGQPPKDQAEAAPSGLDKLASSISGLAQGTTDLASVSQILSSMETSVDGLVTAINDFLPELTSTFNTILGKFEEAAGSFATIRGEITTIEAEIAQVNLTADGAAVE